MKSTKYAALLIVSVFEMIRATRERVTTMAKAMKKAAAKKKKPMKVAAKKRATKRTTKRRR